MTATLAFHYRLQAIALTFEAAAKPELHRFVEAGHVKRQTGPLDVNHLRWRRGGSWGSWGVKQPKFWCPTTRATDHGAPHAPLDTQWYWV